MDLGAKPWKVFFLITIPMIAPSLAAGGMMSFALSLDDLVLASFVSGPGSTTLPMEVFSAVAARGETRDQRGGQPDPVVGIALYLRQLVSDGQGGEAPSRRDRHDHPDAGRGLTA